jgi:hypothetical protein
LSADEKSTAIFFLHRPVCVVSLDQVHAAPMVGILFGGTEYAVAEVARQ